MSKILIDEALRYADELDRTGATNEPHGCAAELRRLHAENQALRHALEKSEATMKQALEALKEVSNSTGIDDYGHYVLSTEYDIAKVELATQVLDKALAQSRSDEEQPRAEGTLAPAQEPYGWKVDGYIDLFHCEHEAKAAAKEINSFAFPLYTTPPAQPWVGLTDAERHNIREWQEIQKELGPVWAPMMLYLYLAIEAKLKEKNT